MKSHADLRFRLGLLLLSVFCITSGVHAQGRVGHRSTQYGRPSTSPYLNLLNRGGGGSDLDFALNYYQQYRPQQQFRSSISQLQQSQNRLSNSIANSQQVLQTPKSQLGVTGHSTSFLNLGNYYPILQTGR